ncbi:MAG: MarR family transcriptional regulator [Magnetococcales bacterium]|nr:MarR family transcriptional regulator [Magnetococcales bacterium]
MLTETNYGRTEQVLVALRQIIRAVDLHSRQLYRASGLTTPQTLILKEIIEREGITAIEIGKRIHLSRATVADILLRLENKGLIDRVRSTKDRRQVHITATAKAISTLSSSPPLLQERFTTKFVALKSWEQLQILSALQQTADMMNAEHLDVEPLLLSEPLVNSDEYHPEPDQQTKRKVL